MRLRKTSTVSMTLPLVLLILLVGLLAGCGGNDQSGGGQQGGGKAGGVAAKKEKLSRKVAIGTVRAYKDDRRRLSLRPALESQGDGPLAFKVRKKAQVTLDGQQAELGDIEEGQQAQIRYVVVNEVNRAIIVQLFSKQPSGGDKKEKKPSGEDKKPSGEDKKPSGEGEKAG